MDPIADIVLDIGLAGAADILLMTGLIYGALAWMRSNHMRNLLRGVVTVVALYLAARFFELQLTSTSLEVVLVVVGVAAIVLYGGEIRRLVERIALFGGPRRSASASSAQAAELARVLFALGKVRIGALVVLEGRDPVESLVTGGTALDGVPSEPLLHSIFDPHSMGHDGAVILKNGRLWRFGCHLPLSKQHATLGHRGLRHAAALGMSEQSDALCIAVSEERGSVTLCANGELEELPDESALTQRIASFSEAPRQKRARWRLPRLHGTTLAAALLMAALSWMVIVHGGRPIERSYVLAISTENAPPNVELQAVHPKEVRVTVSGAGRDFYLVNPNKIQVTVSLEGLKPGQHAVPIGKSQVVLPRGLTLVSVEPSRVSLSLVPRR